MIHANDNRPINFISMFSGIEAASVAFKPLGWKALCFAEIEKFPAAVLAHHYPDVPNVGDMSKHDWSQYAGKVDIVCGGPPCQDFSVAGLRAGLDGDRGNLSLVYMRALHAIKPRNAIVENVPGWLNDKKNAFGCFLAGLVGADDPLLTPDGKSWPNAGMVAGPLGRAAWRVLDAQYFNLAQRRRRVLVVADFGNGADPATVLFEPESVCRNPPSRGEAGKDIAGTISARTEGGGGLGTDFDLDGGLRVQTFDRQSNCEYGQAGIASTVSARDYKSPTDLVAVSVTGDIAHTLKAEGADASEDGTARGTPIVAFNNTGQGWWNEAETAATVRKGDDNGGGGARESTIVAQTVAIRGRDGGATAELGGDVATALRASQGGGDKPHVLCFSAKDYGADASYELSPTLRAGGFTGSHANGGVMPAIAFGGQMSTPQVDVEITQTLQAKNPQAVATASAVRRLTPTECERLQGFPDGYTDIPWRGKPTSPDGPRYKALGNSWAVPKFTWLGRRIAALMPPAQAGGVVSTKLTPPTSTPQHDNDNLPARHAA